MATPLQHDPERIERLLEPSSGALHAARPAFARTFETKGPDFFLVGAPKCGTTALDHYLRQHPEVHMARVKEAHHFGSDLRIERGTQFDDRDRYLELFDGAGSERRVGESSVFYLYSERAAKEIQAFRPGARIIAMVRNPIDQMHSYHSERLYRGTEDIVDFEEALAAEGPRRAGLNLPSPIGFADGVQYRKLASFSAQLERYFQVFGSEAVHVIVHDDMVREPDLVWEQACKFLDIDPAFRPEMKPVNVNKRIRSKRLRSLMRDGRLRSMARALVPASLRHKLLHDLKRLNQRRESRAPMSLALRRRLQSEFELEIKRLSLLLDRDLMHWVRD